MSFDVNVLVFIAFLIANLTLGIAASRGVNTIRGYAIGDRDFNTATLASTIVALWVSGEFFVTIVTESYKDGLIFMSILIADFLSYFMVGVFFAPRFKEFLGKISIAEAMGEMYGQRVRVITAVAGFIGVSGIIAIQLQIAGVLFQYALGVPLSYGIVVSGLIITLYSSLGGIKSVTFTDVVQFATFGVVMPLIAFILLNNLGSYDAITETLANNPKFSFSVFSFDNPRIYFFISLFVWLLIPHFNPALFQRAAMAKNVQQIRDSYIIASIAGLVLAAMTCWIGVLLLSKYPNLEGDQILKLIILDYEWFWGFKGLIIAGIMAMIMSTVDSYINSNSILLIHDLKDALHVKFTKNEVNELLSTRVCAAIIGTISIAFALRGGNFFELILWTSTLYMPIVTVPFIMSLLGFRSSGKSVFAGMVAGFVTVIIWEFFIKEHAAGVGGLIPGMLANLMFLFGYHYTFNQSGGWVGIKDPSALIEAKQKRKEMYQNFIACLKNFNFMDLLKKNTPKNDRLISFLGIMVMVSMFSSISTMEQQFQESYKVLFSFFYPITLVLATLLISYPLWISSWKDSDLLPIVWNTSIFCILTCFSFLLVLISHFAEIQLMIFMVNILIVSSIVHWRWASFLLSSGIVLVFMVHQLYFPVENFFDGVASLEFKIVYLLFLVTAVLVMFFKPKQEHLEETEAHVGDLNAQVGDLNEKVTNFSERVADQAKEIERLGATAQKILNNVNHELRLPVGNVMNFAEMLKNGLKMHSPEELQELSDQVYKNSTRLSSMILNMLDLANLDVKKVHLEKTLVNFSEIVKDRVKICQNMYLQGKKINFKMIIDPEIMISVDPNYIRQVVDNLVINAINFSEDGTIEVQVKKAKDRVIFTIKDQGIGISKEEVFDIFTPFKMGSKTESKAEGRGVGLALCKSVIDAHEGVIIARSNGKKGAIFEFALAL